jgi:hypothetical protein
MIENYDNVDMFVGKSEHHAVTLNKAGKVVVDKPRFTDQV